MSRDPRLNRRIRLEIGGLDASVAYEASLTRIDAEHSNIAAHCPPDVVWPDEQLWSSLREHDVLATESLPQVGVADVAANFDFPLPMPGVGRIRLRPVRPTPATWH
jgi:hypothetical protein